VDGEATSPTTANVVVTPPTGGPWEKYEVKLCPVGGPASGCVTVTCTTPSSCPVTGLTPETSYVTTAVAIKPDGTRSPPSNEDIFTTPGMPILTSAEAYGPTTGQATAAGPAGVTYTQWRFTATPVGGGTPVTANNTAPDVRFYGLTPNTTVSSRRACWELEVQIAPSGYVSLGL